jgi:hypothetical protein
MAPPSRRERDQRLSVWASGAPVTYSASSVGVVLVDGISPIRAATDPFSDISCGTDCASAVAPMVAGTHCKEIVRS